MNNYFNLKTIINRNVLYLQQRVDNVIIVNTPPQSSNWQSVDYNNFIKK